MHGRRPPSFPSTSRKLKIPQECRTGNLLTHLPLRLPRPPPYKESPWRWIKRNVNVQDVLWKIDARLRTHRFHSAMHLTHGLRKEFLPQNKVLQCSQNRLRMKVQKLALMDHGTLSCPSHEEEISSRTLSSLIYIRTSTPPSRRSWKGGMTPI